MKPTFDWLIGRRKDRVSSEELIRDDMMAQLKEQRLEIAQLRLELADARRELREFSDMHQHAVAEWQDRYSKLLLEMSELRSAMDGGKMSQKTHDLS